jgi:hypothetical protein
MRKTFVMGVAGAGLLLLGLVSGLLLSGRLTAFAAASPHHAAVTASGTGVARYCQVYEQTLVNDLNVSQSALESANVDALQNALDQMKQDGQITAVEETQLAQLLQQMGTQPCTHLTSSTVSTFLQHDTLAMQQFVAARVTLANAVAGALGIGPSALATDLSGGQTVSQIAKARNVSLDVVKAAYLNAVKSFLAQDVSNRVITQEQSEYAYNLIAQAAGSGHYLLLDGGGK